MSTSYWDSDDGESALLSELHGWTRIIIRNYSKENKPVRTPLIKAGSYKWCAIFFPEGSNSDSKENCITLSFAREDLTTKTQRTEDSPVTVQFSIAMGRDTDREGSKYFATAVDTFTKVLKLWMAHVEKNMFERYINEQDYLIIEVHVQVLREPTRLPFRCFASLYKRKLLREYLTNLEQECGCFVEKCMGQYVKLFNDETSWSSLEAFWKDMDSDFKKSISCEKREIVLNKVHECLRDKKEEKERWSMLFMESLWYGLKDIEVKKGVLEQNGGSFVLGDSKKDLFSILEGSAKDFLPPKDGSPRGEFNKDLIESDERRARRLIEWGRWTIERFVLTHIFSNVVSSQTRKDLVADDGGSPPNFNPKEREKNPENKQVHGDNDGDEVKKSKSFTGFESVLENPTKLHLMTISNKILGQGSSSKVFEGEFSYMPVAIKRIHCKNGKKELENIRKVRSHPNLVEFHGCEWDENNSYLYLAFERCTCTLLELITGNDDIGFNRDLLWDGDTNLSLGLIGAIIDGVSHLHSWNLIHRDLTPENILVKISTSKDGVCTLIPKISDFGLLKDLDEIEVLPKDLDGEKMLKSSPDFHEHYMYRDRAIPEQIKDDCLTKKSDIYCLGIIIAFILSRGQMNKVPNVHANFASFVSYYFKSDNPEAFAFLMTLADNVPSFRPSINQVKNNPFLWSSQKKIDFLEQTFVFLKEKDTENQTKNFSNGLESIKKVVLRTKVRTWNNNLNEIFQKDMSLGVISTESSYNVQKLMDLLRYIRNKKHHPESVSLTRDGVSKYFLVTFPHLFSEVYKYVKETYKEEGVFSEYFKQEKALKMVCGVEIKCTSTMLCST